MRQIHGYLVYPVVVVSIAREFAFNVETFGKTDFVTVCGYFCIFNRRQRIGCNRQSCRSVCQIDTGIGIDKCHLRFFVIVFVVHVMNDVHRFVVHACDLFQYHFVVCQYLIVIQDIARQHRNAFYHYRPRVFTTSAVYCQQQGFCQVCPGSEELNLTSDILKRYAAGDSVIVGMTYRTHQVVVFVLDRRGVDRNFCTEVLESFGQFGTPQHRHIGFGRRT